MGRFLIVGSFGPLYGRLPHCGRFGTSLWEAINATFFLLSSGSDEWKIYTSEKTPFVVISPKSVFTAPDLIGAFYMALQV